MSPKRLAVRRAGIGLVDVLRYDSTAGLKNGGVVPAGIATVLARTHAPAPAAQTTSRGTRLGRWFPDSEESRRGARRREERGLTYGHIDHTSRLEGAADP